MFHVYKGVEAGSGNNIWVNNRLEELLHTKREVGTFFLKTISKVEHVELKEFLEIIADIKEVQIGVFLSLD